MGMLFHEFLICLITHVSSLILNKFVPCHWVRVSHEMHKNNDVYKKQHTEYANFHLRLKNKIF